MKSSIAAALLALSSTAFAQTSQKCQGDVCFSLNVPDATASSGKGDIFFQIKAPTSYAYVALGQGTAMAGSTIFVVYQNAAGTNVTLSPRAGTGHVQPQYSAAVQATLLPGSGVSGGNLTANIKCSSCAANADFKTTAGSWIFGVKTGAAIKSDSTSAAISIHSSKGQVAFDYAAAKGGSSANPFSAKVAEAGETIESREVPSRCASPPGRPGWWNPGRPNVEGPSTDNCYQGSGEGCPGGARSNLANYQGYRTAVIAHAVLACLAFAVILPIGGILIRLLNFPGLVWLHAFIQLVAYCLYVVAFALGVYMATNARFDAIDMYHPVIGIVLFVLLTLQPVLGLVHHSLFKTHGRRMIWSYLHVWGGRIIITLGIINGGLGFMFARDGGSQAVIIYVAVAGTIWFVYFMSACVGESRRKESPVLLRRSSRSGRHTETKQRKAHVYYSKHGPAVRSGKRTIILDK